MDPWIRFGDELRHDLASRWLAGGTDHVPSEKPRPPTPPHDLRRVLRSSTSMAEPATRYALRRRHLTISSRYSTRKSNVVALHQIRFHRRAPHEAALHLYAVPRDGFTLLFEGISTPESFSVVIGAVRKSIARSAIYGDAVRSTQLMRCGAASVQLTSSSLGGPGLP